MKPLIQILLLALLLATGYTAKAQVMISQYIEGVTGTNHKGIEVYNYTAYPIDFSVTPLEVYEGKDGAACTNLPGATVNSGVLMPFQVWVIGTPDLTAFALNGSDISGTTTNGFDFTGNDALELYLGGTLMDVIGTCESNPVTSWSGNGVSTAGQNIATKSGVCAGIINSWTDPSTRFETIGIGADMTGFGESPSCPTQECMHESFVNIPTGSSTNYLTRTWTGDNGYDFTATDSRTDQSINGKAITIRNGSLTVTGVTGGIGALSLTTQRAFTKGSGSIEIRINNTLVGTALYDSTSLTTTINGINIIGPINLEIVSSDGNDDNRVKIDDLKWTCYDSPVITSITSVSSLAYSVDCYATDNGTVNFTSAGVFAPGNTFTAELSNETGSFINYTEIGTLSLSGTDPSGTVPFTIPPNTTAGTNYRIRVVSDNPPSNVTDNGSNITISNSVPCSLVKCMSESFESLVYSGSYGTKTWTGDNGYTFKATDARVDEPLNGKAITIRNGSLTVSNVTGGIGTLTLTTQRAYTGGSGSINILINGNSVGTAPYSGNPQTTTINGINISGLIDLEIVVGSSVDRIKIDDLIWTCYDSPVTTSISSVSSSTFSVDCYTSATGTVSFTTVGTFAPGNTFTAELSDETGSFFSTTAIGTLISGGLNPSGTVPFTIPINTTAGTNYRIRVVSDNPPSNVTDNGSNITISNSTPCSSIECLNESFDNIGSSTATYATVTWIGNNGHSFTATKARTDQNINGRALTINDGKLTVLNVPGGIGALTLTTQREFAGGSGTIDILINDVLVGTIPYDGTVQTTTINGINTTGNIKLEIDFGDNGDRIKIDDLIWSCYSSPFNTSISSISSITHTVDCKASSTGTVNFISTGNFASGNTFTAELSDETGSFINYTQIGSLSSSGTDPSGTIIFTIPANTISGTAYRIRVVSDTPYSNVTDNGNDISINNTQPCIPIVPLEGALLINEFSNGPAGSQEYYELLVVGECGGTIDIRGYIIDDNNGDFGTIGISTGHLKISNDPQWSNIAVGSIIVIYNSSSGGRNPHIPSDDLTDTNLDSVYVIPYNNTTYLSISYEFPNQSDNSYNPDTGTPTLTSWENTVGFNNSADAAQTRKPNGDYFFGISYGVGNTGGVDNTKISSTNMAKTNVYFNSGDFRNINNWSIGDATNDGATTDETPGAANNPANQEWIDMLRSSTGSCGLVALPVKMLKFEGEFNNKEVDLYWKTATELNNNYYELFHSKTGYEFESIAQIDGHGTVSSPKEYSFKHRNSSSGIHYYRLESVDYDGKTYDKGTISVQIERDEIHYDSNTQILHFPSKGEYHVYSTSGKKVFKVKDKAQVSFSKKGFFLVHNVESGVVTKILIY